MAHIVKITTNKGIKYKVEYECRTEGLKGVTRKRKSHTFPLGTPRREVEKFLQEVQYRHFSGEKLFMEGERKNLWEFCDEYFTTFTSNLSPLTVKGYRGICYGENGLFSYFNKDTKLSKITSLDLQAYLNYLHAQGKAKKSISNARGFVSVLFTKAVRCGIIKENPAADLVIPYNAKPKKEEKIMSIEVAKLALEYSAELGGHYETITWLGLLAGLRKGEIAGLRFDNVFVENGMSEIHVEETRVPVGNGVIEKPPKSTAGRRCVQIPEMLAEMLRRKKKEYAKERLVGGRDFQDTGYVIHRSDGLPLHPDGIYRYHTKFMKKLQEKYPNKGIEHCRLHGLRHCYGSMAMESGMSVKSLMGQMGHATMDMVNLYSHAYEQSKKDGAERINDLLTQKMA